MNAYRDSRPARGIPAVHCGEDVNPAIILSPADLQYLNDREIQDLVAKSQEKTGTTVRRKRRNQDTNATTSD